MKKLFLSIIVAFMVISISHAQIKDDMMMLRVRKTSLGIFINANIVFKWADNCGDNIEGFYSNGDAAPIGRAGYCYGNR